MLQTRILHKMFGVACSERYLVNHGGLGENPIWRLGVRGPRPKLLRVKRIDREVTERPVWDLQTDDHYVYLPEADVTVSNCDDMAALIAALVLAVGGECQIVTVAFSNVFYQGQRQYSHVYAAAREPQSGKWIILDPVAADRTAQMRSRVVHAKLWPVA